MQGIDFSLISVIIGIFVGLGTLIAGCGFAYAQFKTGGDKAKDDLIETLRATAEAEKAEKTRLASEKTELIASHQVQITQLSKDISELKGRFDETQKRANEYKEILQGRDPAQQKFMEVVLKQIEEGQKQSPAVQQYMRETAEILKEIRDFMQKLNEKGVV
jgi:hypothetical protein